MDFSFTTEQDTFRAELRAWLAANVPPTSGLRHLQDRKSVV